MSTLLNNARKITAARVIGACTGAAAVAAVTKNYATVSPVLAVALAGAAAVHYKSVKEIEALENDEELVADPVTLGELAATGAASAVEVGLVSVLASKLICYGKTWLSAPGETETETVADTTPDVVTE